VGVDVSSAVELNPDAVDTFLKSWGPTKNDDGSERYECLLVILRPDGSKIAAFPKWSTSENTEKEELRAELYKWLDCVVDGIHS
jgi:hypothetical protein